MTGVREQDRGVLFVTNGALALQFAYNAPPPEGNPREQRNGRRTRSGGEEGPALSRSGASAHGAGAAVARGCTGGEQTRRVRGADAAREGVKRGAFRAKPAPAGLTAAADPANHAPPTVKRVALHRHRRQESRGLVAESNLRAVLRGGFFQLSLVGRIRLEPFAFKGLPNLAILGGGPQIRDIGPQIR